MPDILNILHSEYKVNPKILDSLQQAAEYCKPMFQAVEDIAEYNQVKVLQAFQKNGVSDFHLQGSTGYGYGDSGRDTLESVYATAFKAERALVRSQIVSGTHAIAIALLGNLGPGDELISATGAPYDTLQKVIGYHDEPGSCRKLGVIYKEIALKDQDIDLDALVNNITKKTRLILFQRSKGYEWRPSFTPQKLGRVIQEVKRHYPNVICLVDNCYGEFVDIAEPLEYGADLIAGSLIKNPGGGLALTGGYLAGKEEYILQAANRLTAPGIGLGVGASLNFNHLAFQGFFLAPSIVAEALKGAILGAIFFKLLGYSVLPQAEEPRTDIIQAIKLGDRDKMIAFCRGLQRACALDAHVTPEPALLPGYEDEVIMAGGTFIQGSSIEMSSDGPLRPPYNIYLQGGLSLAHVKVGLALAAEEILKQTGDL